MSKPIQRDHRLLKEIRLDNLLSFGPGSPALPLEALNVLIGPNGSGKSNLLEAIALLRSSTTDWRPVISRGGGVGEWIWKGQPDEPASVEALTDSSLCVKPGLLRRNPLRHTVTFRRVQQTFQLVDERIGYEHQTGGDGESIFAGYRYHGGHPVITSPQSKGRVHEKKVELTDPTLSVLKQHLGPEHGSLATAYDRIRLYREWVFGQRNTPLRDPQRADLRTDRLEEDFSNLGLFLKRIGRSPKTKEALLSALRDLYEGLTDFDVSIEGGTVQVFFNEGEFLIPAPRLSDGSVRYLCLLAILCDPEPPPLICIEEPELGLHPDILPKLADHLVAASQRTQIIVTTHSDILVDAMTERPEAVVVCEKHDGRTQMQRLNREDLTVWLEKYRLGQLWTKGQLGGTRW
ncbi:MAG: AAA family ATPase [Planctomycetota bacterium]|nr:AAA family ATPase [Planctomycetota bacterium]